MACGARRLAFVVIYGILAGLLPSACACSDVAGARRQEHEPRHLEARRQAAVKSKGATLVIEGGEEGDEKRPDSSEAEAIKPIGIPFKQSPDDWEKTGISLTASGEPKSGTTWLARVMVELCLQLCGNPENTWCKMGGLTVLHRPPAPRYDFEMLNAETGELYLHFQGKLKHEIPGLEVRGVCNRGGRPHQNTFGKAYPCSGAQGGTTRDILLACLPDTSPDCVPFLPTRDPSVRRMAVVFRDARNLMISEHRMRIEAYHQDIGELEPFVLKRFKRIVAWIHQRWVWHTTYLKDVSHVMFYEDLEDDPRHLVDLAAFMGLDCTPQEADDVWQRHTYPNRPGDYTTYGLSHETLEWMNNTMATLLPEPMLERYGLTLINA